MEISPINHAVMPLEKTSWAGLHLGRRRCWPCWHTLPRSWRRSSTPVAPLDFWRLPKRRTTGGQWCEFVAMGDAHVIKLCKKWFCLYDIYIYSMIIVRTNVWRLEVKRPWRILKKTLFQDRFQFQRVKSGWHWVLDRCWLVNVSQSKRSVSK